MVAPHEIRTLLDFLRRPRFESSFSTFCRRRDRPSFNTPGLRHRHQEEVWEKSHGVWLEARRHQLELHHTLDIGFETRGAVSKDLPSF